MLYYKELILRVSRLFCIFKLFPMVGKGLMKYLYLAQTRYAIVSVSQAPGSLNTNPVWIITVGHRPFAEPQTLMAER